MGELTWGPLDCLNYLPRIMVGRVVISLARWLLTENEIKALSGGEQYDRFMRVQELRYRRQLPRWIVLTEGDNALPIDLDNALSVESFIQLISRRSRAKLVELFPDGRENVCLSQRRTFFS